MPLNPVDSANPGARRHPLGNDRGQTTAEYALVLIAAASIAMLVVAWATDSGAIGTFFDSVFERITEMLP